MSKSSLNTRVSAETTYARTRALTYCVSQAILNRHREEQGDELAQKWGITNALRPKGFPDLARLLAASGKGLPKAIQMTPAEIASALSSGVDPYAAAVDGTGPRQVLHPPLMDLLAAVHLASWFPDCDPDIGPFPPGVTLIRAADDTLRDRVEDALDYVLSPFWQAVTNGSNNVEEHVEVVALGKAASTAAINPQRRFRESMDEALAKGLGIVALARDADDLSDAGKMLLLRDVTWPELDSSAVIELLRATHSETDEVAEDELRSRLQTVPSLAALPWPIIHHAFHAETTLAVANRLVRAHLPAPPTVGRTLDDVCGLPAVTADLWHLVSDVQSWQRNELDWQDVSASILLHGPPGTGKTMIAEALAGSAGATFVSTSFAEAQKAGHLGDYLKAINQRVDRAIANAPSVFFIDELDSYRERQKPGNNFSDYMHSVVNGLLEQLTKLNDAPGVIVIAATNHPNIIDPALVRAGRFDRKIAVGLPDKDGIAAILRGHLGTDAIPVDDLSSRMVGLSGADIATIARSAKGHARRTREQLSSRHVLTAADEHVPAIDPAHLYLKAIHEAGHAVVAHILGLPPGDRIFVSATGGGYDSPLPPAMTAEVADRELALFFGGRAAEIVFFGKPSTGSGGSEASDLCSATSLAIDMEQVYGFGKSLLHGPVRLEDRHKMPLELRKRVEGRLRAAEGRALGVIRENRKLVSRIADALVQERELDKEGLYKLLTNAAVADALKANA